MEESKAADLFAALSHPTRIAAIRHLLRAVPNGLPAGALAELLTTPASTLSHHLAALEKAGLVQAERRQRHIFYHAMPEIVRDLIGFFINECCGGDASLCLPAGSNLQTSCT